MAQSKYDVPRVSENYLTQPTKHYVGLEKTGETACKNSNNNAEESANTQIYEPMKTFEQDRQNTEIPISMFQLTGIAGLDDNSIEVPVTIDHKCETRENPSVKSNDNKQTFKSTQTAGASVCKGKLQDELTQKLKMRREKLENALGENHKGGETRIIARDQESILQASHPNQHAAEWQVSEIKPYKDPLQVNMYETWDPYRQELSYSQVKRGFQENFEKGNNNTGCQQSKAYDQRTQQQQSPKVPSPITPRPSFPQETKLYSKKAASTPVVNPRENIYHYGFAALCAQPNPPINEPPVQKQQKPDWSPNKVYIIIGESGAGKSLLINYLSGGNFAKTGSGFSVTKSCQEYYIFQGVFEKSILIDTQGLFDTSESTNSEIANEIIEKLTLTYKFEKIDGFIICQNIENNRVRIFNVLNEFIPMLSSLALESAVVLITHGHKLVHDQMEYKDRYNEILQQVHNYARLARVNSIPVILWDSKTELEYQQSDFYNVLVRMKPYVVDKVQEFKRKCKQKFEELIKDPAYLELRIDHKLVKVKKPVTEKVLVIKEREVTRKREQYVPKPETKVGYEEKEFEFDVQKVVEKESEVEKQVVEEISESFEEVGMQAFQTRMTIKVALPISSSTFSSLSIVKSVRAIFGAEEEIVSTKQEYIIESAERILWAQYAEVQYSAGSYGTSVSVSIEGKKAIVLFQASNAYGQLNDETAQVNLLLYGVYEIKRNVQRRIPKLITKRVLETKPITIIEKKIEKGKIPKKEDNFKVEKIMVDEKIKEQYVEMEDRTFEKEFQEIQTTEQMVLKYPRIHMEKIALDQVRAEKSLE